MFNRIAIAVAVVSLAACGAPRPRPITRPLPVQAVLQSLPAPGEYPIDSSGSELRLLVYRAGTGRVQIGADVPSSSFSLSLRAEDFVIDDAQARQEEGGDFPGDIPDDAKAGTRRNMLSNAVLNAAEFPDITVKSVSLAGTLSELNADLEVGAAGHTSRVSVPLSLQDDAHGFTALGSVELRQTALGLIPYSLLHGALQVQDAMQLKFRIKVLTN